MRQLTGGFIALLLLPALYGADEINLLEVPWENATAEARESAKYLYVAFLGDGWSLSSKRFKEGILESDVFRRFAEDRLVYGVVMARRTPKLSKKERARLQALVIHLDIKSYPTLILLAPDGREILRHGFREEPPDEYLALLEAVIPPVTDPGPPGN